MRTTSRRWFTHQHYACRRIVLCLALLTTLAQSWLGPLPALWAQPLAVTCSSFTVDGLIGVKWSQLGGSDGPLGCPIATEQNVSGGDGRYQPFEHGQIATSTNYDMNFAIAAYQEASSLIVDWGDTAPHYNYDYFNVRWDKDGVNIGQMSLHDGEAGTTRTHGHWPIPEPTLGTYRIIVEGCDDGSIGFPSTCRQSWSSPVFVNYAPIIQLTTTVSKSAVAYCPALPCPTLAYTLALSVSDGATMAELTAMIPSGLTFIDGSTTGGATYDSAARQVHFHGPVTLSTPVTLIYRAVLDPGVPPGAILDTSIRLSGPSTSIQRSIPVAVQQSDFRGSEVLIYASGDNNLSGDILRLVDEAERGAANPNVVALLLLDGPADDDTYLVRLQPSVPNRTCPNRYSDPTCDGRYTLGQNLWHWPTDNLGDRYTLAAFLRATELAYPNASRRVLSLVGHGGGWSPPALGGQPSGHGGQPSTDPLGGMLWDNHPGTSLSTPALGMALQDAMHNLDTDDSTHAPHKIDLLYLDACDMAMAEVAYEVRDSAHALLASANWKWAGFPYDRHLASVSGDGLAIGQSWMHNEAQYLLLYHNEPFTYAVVNLDTMAAVHDAANALAMAFMRPNGPLASEDGRQRILKASREADRYDSDQNGAITLEDNYVDLLSFASATAKAFAGDTIVMSATQALAQAVTAASSADLQSGSPWIFPGQQWTWQNSTGGLSIYLPLHADDWRRRYYGLLQFTDSSAWQQFVNAWWQNAQAPTNPTCPPACGLPPPQLAGRLYLPLVRR